MRVPQVFFFRIYKRKIFSNCPVHVNDVNQRLSLFIQWVFSLPTFSFNELYEEFQITRSATKTYYNLM